MTVLGWIFIMICAAIVFYMIGSSDGAAQERKNPKCIQVGSEFNPYNIRVVKPSDELYQRYENEIAMLKEQIKYSQDEVKQQAGRIYSLESQNKKLEKVLKRYDVSVPIRAEGLNRSFAEGGIVSGKINSKDVRL